MELLPTYLLTMDTLIPVDRYIMRPGRNVIDRTYMYCVTGLENGNSMVLVIYNMNTEELTVSMTTALAVFEIMESLFFSTSDNLPFLSFGGIKMSSLLK